MEKSVHCAWQRYPTPNCVTTKSWCRSRSGALNTALVSRQTSTTPRSWVLPTTWLCVLRPCARSVCITSLRTLVGTASIEPDEVYARADDFRIGTFAEFIPVKETSLATKPKGLTMDETASIPLVGLTAWQALVEIAQLTKGQKVFIQAGSGGVGTFAIQLAKHLGATVATTTSAANAALVKRLGADIVIDYKTQDFEEVLRDYDVVLHSQDGQALEKSLRVLRRGGKLVSISGPADPTFGKQIAAPGFVRLVIWLLSAGVRRRARDRGVDYAFLFMKASGSQLREITRLIEAGAIRPVIDKVFPYPSTNEALAYVESGRAKGKVVIRVK